MTKKTETETENLLRTETMQEENNDSMNESSPEGKETEKTKTEARKNIKKAPAKKYFKVRFHERFDESEPVSITLGINGNLLVIQRGVEVILPEDYLILAKRCTIRSVYPVIEGTKTVMKKMTKPRASFDLLGEATEAEYLKMKAEGDAKVAKAMKEAQEE